MNIFRTAAFRASARALILPLAALLFAGCEVGSTDSTTAVASDNSGTIYNYAGLYMNPDNDGTNILELVYPATEASHPSGTRITYLRLLQYGTVLEAYDSAGMIWNGSISSIQSGTATFSLRGRTTAGMSTEISGTMVYASQQSTMDAAWIEPSYYGNLYAQATVAPSATNSPSTDLQLTSQYASLSISNSTTLTASGCSSTYAWECDENFGSLVSSGSSATYTRTSGTSSNNESISVSCSGEKKTITIEFN